MRQLIKWACFFSTLFFASEGWAQPCRPCPEQYTIQDSACTFIRAIQGANNFIISDSIRACQGSTISYTITAGIPGCNYPGISYTISVSGGVLISSSGNAFTIQWGSGASGMVSIHYLYNSPVGAVCDGFLFIQAILTPAPIASFTAAPNPACFNNPTTINFNASASTGAASYFWDFGDSFQGTGVAPSHNYTAPGTYTVTLIVSTPTSSGGGNGSANPRPCPECSDTAQLQVVINNLPGPPITCIGTVCADETATYCTSAICTGYTWTVTGGTIISGLNTPCITVLWGSGNPQGTVQLTTTGCPGYCPQGTTVNVPIIPATTTINGSTIACVGATSTYSLPTWPGCFYTWSLSGGGNITSFNTNTPQLTVAWTTAGNWTITCNYYDSSAKCGGTATINVTVRPQASITGNNQICSGANVVLTSVVPVSSPVSSVWSITSGTAAFVGGNTGSSVTLTSSTPGTFTVTANPGTNACNQPTFTVTVLANPILGPITGRDSICPGATYVYAVSSNTTGMFTWNTTNGTAVNLGTFNDSVQVTWGASGPYNLSVSQVSAANNCPSNLQTFQAHAYPTPILTGPLTVCADAQVNYTISNITGGPFNWYVTPTQLGTVITVNGNTVSILWHGSTSPGSTNTAWLHYGRCSDDSVAITITEPVLPVITQTGGLCATGGVVLTTNATGSFAWSGPGGYISNSPTATGITVPGIYTVVITGYNGTGCNVTATWNVPDIGRPVAHISASEPLIYCLPNVPNMNLVAASGAGYSYAWYQVTGSGNIAVGTNVDTLHIGGITTPGTYTFFVNVTLNGCTIQSNLITITITNTCAQPCNASLVITGITGCNPFTISITAGAPSGSSVVPGTTTISYQNAPNTSGNTTMTFDSVGYQQVSICADILLPGGGTTRCCKDTVVLVKIAPKFIANNNCGLVTLTDLSTVIFPCTIGSYAWSAGSYPGNAPLPTGVAIFNNSSASSPVLTFTQSGTYIITQTINGCSCTASFMDTITVSVPNAAFTAANSCVGTPISINPGTPGTHYWDFGDAATSYISPTSHAYGNSGPYTITHIITDANGCSDTATQVVNIAAAPTCNITYSGATTFCAGGSLVLNACTGFAPYQWFNNGVPVGTGPTFTAIQTGNYWFTGVNSNNCMVHSDTVSITVNPAPPAGITTNGAKCVGSPFTMSVPNCNTCIYSWTDNGNPMPQTSSSISATISAGQVGTHLYQVVVINTATGCTATGSISVSFFNLPTISISVAGSPTQLCSGNVYTLNASSNASSPSWAWTHNGSSFVIGTSPTQLASSSGTYWVAVTDGITGCRASTGQPILPSPDLSLFPMGCDSLCDTSTLYLPLASNNNNLAGYIITWYKNAPPYTTVVGSGPSISLSSLLLGSQNLSVIVTAPNGCVDTSNNYSVTVIPCGPVVCTCVGGAWDTLYWQPYDVPIDTGGKTSNIILPGNSFTCGQSLGVIDCKHPIQIFASWACQPASCDSAVTWTLTGPVSLSGIMPFNTAGLPAGSYTLTLTGKCGDSVCNKCQVPFVIKCDTIPPPVDCCKNSHWEFGPLWINSATGASMPIDCAKGTSIFNINAVAKNCYDPYLVKGTWICPDTCGSQVVYELLDVAGNVIVTATGSLIIPTSLPNGIYTVNILAYCGGKLCHTCTFKIRKDCKCDCPPGKNIQVLLTTNEAEKPYKCGDKLPDVDCKNSVVLSASYNCTPGQCPAALSYVLTGPSGTSTGTLPLVLNSLAPGNYSIVISAYCNGKLCKECVLTFTVKCPKIPVCCPKKIEVVAGHPSYSILPDSSGTAATQTFSFTGLTGPYIQVRAEVLQFDLSSNYNNECISCVNLPFTWGSMAGATSIGPVPAAVNMFNGATIPVFSPVGSAVYQNPMVISWTSNTPFSVGGPVTIKYLLPPLPKIDCCTLQVRVCIRFTFRDAKCQECSVVICMNAQLARDDKGVYVLR
jgi:PKD repeat protein